MGWRDLLKESAGGNASAGNDTYNSTSSSVKGWRSLLTESSGGRAGGSSASAGSGKIDAQSKDDNLTIEKKDFLTSDFQFTPQQQKTDAGTAGGAASYLTGQFSSGAASTLDNIRTDLISKIGYGAEKLTSLGGLAKNPLSNFFEEATGKTLSEKTPLQEFADIENNSYDNVSKGLQGAGMIQNNLGAMVPYAAAGAAGFGNMALFSSASGGAAREAYQKSGNLDKAMAYGVLSGAAEVLTEKLVDSMGGLLGKGLINRVTEKVIKNPVVKWLVNSLGEGAEEWISTAVDPYLRRITFDSNASDSTNEERLESAMLGAIAGGIMGGGINIAQRMGNKGAVTEPIQTDTEIASAAEAEKVKAAQTETVPENDLNKKGNVPETFKTDSEAKAPTGVSDTLPSDTMLSQNGNSVNSYSMRENQNDSAEPFSIAEMVEQNKKAQAETEKRISEDIAKAVEATKKGGIDPNLSEPVEGKQVDNNQNTSSADVQEASPEQPRKTMGKADRFKNTYERAAADSVSKAMNIPERAKRENLLPAIRQMTDEYRKTGKIFDETKAKVFETAFNNGIMTLDEFYKDHLALKEDLKTAGVSLPDSEKSSIPDYNQFRKSNFGKVKIVNDGIPVDVKYQELSEQYPDLFPADITSRAEQLTKMAEVADMIKKTEVSLSEYYGEDAASYKEFAREEFEKTVADLESNMSNVTKLDIDFREKQAKRTPKDYPAMTLTELKDAARAASSAKKAAEKAMAKAPLDTAEKEIADLIAKGTLKANQIPEEMNKSEILKVAEAKKAYREAREPLEEYNRQRKLKLEETAMDLLEGSDKWNDNGGFIAKAISFLSGGKLRGGTFSLMTDTFERDMRSITGNKEQADQLTQFIADPVHKNEALSTAFKNQMRKRIKNLDIGTKEQYTVNFADTNQKPEVYQALLEWFDGKATKIVSESTLIQLYGEKILTKGGLQASGADVGKIEKCVAEYRSIYKEVIGKINEVLVLNGYDPIDPRKDYFPHFSEDSSGGLLDEIKTLFGINKNSNLPTDIAGRTHTFSPGKKWMGNLLQRTGVKTAYDSMKGFDSYIESAADIIYHTEDIQRVRALDSALRTKYSQTGVTEEIEKIKNDPDKTFEEKSAELGTLKERDITHLNNMAIYLDAYGNNLAGKKALEDRIWEQMIGRGFYNIMNAAESRIAANMVGLNFGTPLTNLIPIVQATAEVKPKYIAQAMKDTLANLFTNDGFEEKSTFLTNRAGSKKISKTAFQQAIDLTMKPMEFVDKIASNSIVRARYAENIDKGTNDAAAMEDADKWAAKMMADRSKGAIPLIFQSKNPLVRTFTMFQVEVKNQISHLFKDIPQDNREKGLKEIAAILFKYMIGAWLYNKAMNAINGQEPMLDPIGISQEFTDDLDNPEMSTSEAISGLTKNVVQELPFFGSFVGGGRVPISTAFPDGDQVARLLDSDSDTSPEKKLEILAKSLIKPLSYFALPTAAGQVWKTAEGLGAVANNGSYSMTAGGKEKLQYPIDNSDPLNWIKAGLFGKNSLSEAAEWRKNNFKGYSAKETDKYKEAMAMGIDGGEFLSLLNVTKLMTPTKNAAGKVILNTNDKIKQYINSQSGLTLFQKGWLYENLKK